MKWWLISGVVVLVLGAAWYFGFAKIGRALLGMLADGLTTFREWLRQPGSKLKALCALLALASVVISLQSFQRGRQIVSLQTEYVQFRDQAKRQQAELQTGIQTRDERIAEFLRLAEEAKAEIARLKTETAAARMEAAEAKRKAKASAQSFVNQFNNRPRECSAALELMQTACAEFGDY